MIKLTQLQRESLIDAVKKPGATPQDKMIALDEAVKYLKLTNPGAFRTEGSEIVPMSRLAKQ